MPAIEPGSWAPLFRSLAMKTPVRTAFGQHPRLAILGPLEARLQSFDLIILGGLNEGSWPQAAGTDPWFSRPMRASLGLEQPERSIGLSAHDFAMLAAGPRVLLTRALKADGAPTIASRWLQRMEQLIHGLKLDAALVPDCDYAGIAARHDGRGAGQADLPPGAQAARRGPSAQIIGDRNRNLVARSLCDLCQACPEAAPAGSAGPAYRTAGTRHRPAQGAGEFHRRIPRRLARRCRSTD